MKCVYCHLDCTGDNAYHAECHGEVSDRNDRCRCEVCGEKRVRRGDWCVDCAEEYVASGRVQYRNLPPGAP